jgi:hypothetical protein
VGFQWKSARQFLLVIGCVWWEIGYLMVYLYSDSILCVVWEFFFFFLSDLTFGGRFDSVRLIKFLLRRKS